jgi:hypothetical protein
MSSPVAELDAVLTSMLELKPPGVSGAKITSLTSLCNANVQVRKFDHLHFDFTNTNFYFYLVRVCSHSENICTL